MNQSDGNRQNVLQVPFKCNTCITQAVQNAEFYIQMSDMSLKNSYQVIHH